MMCFIQQLGFCIVQFLGKIHIYLMWIEETFCLIPKRLFFLTTEFCNLSRTHLATRFDENNCHAECRHCNRFKADHLEGYRVNLIAKIGQQKFDLLKVKAAGTSKMTDFEYEQLIKYYKTLNKKLRKEKGL